MSVAATTTRVPAVRFKGFEGGWERNGACNIFISVADKGYPTLPVLSASQEFGMVYRDDTGINIHHDISNEIGYKRVQPGQFVSHLRSFQGGFAHSSIEGITSPAYTVFGFLDDQSHYDYYWKYIFNSEAFIKRLEVITYGIRDGRSISFKDFGTLDFSYPSYDEQKKVGQTFQNIDNLITLQQQKYEKLQNVKKAMLAQMFPAPGATTPTVRFAGFTAPWQQSGLSDLCVKFIDGDWIESKDQSDTGVRLVQTGNVGVTEFIDKPDNMKWVSYDTFERLHCEEVLPGDILISRLPEPAGRACIVPSLGSRMITAVDCTIVRTSNQCDNGFLIQYLSSQEYFDQVNTELAGGTRQRIGRSNLASFKVPIPTSYEEQVQIGEYFQHLDNLISLHRRKLEKLQNVKKACLEGMFV